MWIEQEIMLELGYHDSTCHEDGDGWNAPALTFCNTFFLLWSFVFSLFTSPIRLHLQYQNHHFTPILNIFDCIYQSIGFLLLTRQLSTLSVASLSFFPNSIKQDEERLRIDHTRHDGSCTSTASALDKLEHCGTHDSTNT